MKQIYIESYYRNGYSRFMKYILDILNHPKRESIEKRQRPRHGPREGSATKTREICQNPEIYENPKTIGEKH